MNEIQEHLLGMLKWFDSYCRKMGLRYYAIGGTLLGAVRHQGFIPWDDDIDVGMPRKDYELLSKYCTGIQNSKFVIETPHSEDPEYCYTFIKMYDISTTLVENVRKRFVRGIYIDIYPIDGLGNKDEPDYYHLKKVLRLKKLFLSRVTGLRKGRSFKKNMAVIIGRMLPEIIYSSKALREKVDFECQKYDFDQSKWAGNFLGNLGKKEIVPVEYFGVPQPYQFENITILGVEKANDYLTNIYGDWKKFPPADQQVTHHDYVYCNLNKPYYEYEKEVKQ